MNEKIFNNKWSIVVILGAIALTLFLVFQNAQRAQGSAFTGLASTVATSSVAQAVSTTQRLLVATSTGCASRIITSRAAPLMLTFSDVQGIVPTALNGHIQAASTTVAYDSGLYGCGAVRVYAAAADTISVTETY